MSIVIKVVRKHPQATLPKFGSVGAAGADLTAVGLHMDWNTNTLIAYTGLHVEIPQGYGMFLFARSGLARKHGIHLANSVGVIDSDYRGEIQVMLKSSQLDLLGLSKIVGLGDRIAQAVILQIPAFTYTEVDGLEDTDRGHGGFGSTGT